MRGKNTACLGRSNWVTRWYKKLVSVMKVKKKKGTSDGTKFLSLVQRLFVPLRSGQDCTRGWWEMK